MHRVPSAFRKHKWNTNEIFEIRNTPAEKIDEIIKEFEALELDLSDDNLSVTESEAESSGGAFIYYQHKSNQFDKLMNELKAMKKSQLLLTERVTILEKQVENIIDWSKEPLLSALLEISYKTLMSIQCTYSNTLSISEIFNLANNQQVLNTTGISLEDWKDCRTFLNFGWYGRNSKLHGNFPKKSIAYSCYLSLVTKLGHKVPVNVSSTLLNLINRCPE